MFGRLFPTFQLPNIRTYYWLGIFLNGWFIVSNWAFYFLEHLSIRELGLIEGIAILIGIVAEIPSGALADLLGKKKTLVLGGIMGVISCVVLIFATDFLGFLIGNILVFINFALMSGTKEAFAYDSLVERKIEKQYDVVVSRHTTLAIIATIVSIGVGGYLYSIDSRLPFAAWGISLAAATALMLFSTEPKVDTETFSLSNYAKQLGMGVKTLLSKKFTSLLVPILGIASFIKLFQGVVRQNMAADFSFNGETFGYVLALVTIPAAILSFKFEAIIRFFREKKLLVITILACCISFILAHFVKNIVAGGLIFLILMTVEWLASPLISIIVNQRIESKYRATTLSTIALLSQIPYIFLVFVFAEVLAVDRIAAIYPWYIGFTAVITFFALRIRSTAPTHSPSA